ncbi:MAG: hypothetical protein KJ721_01695 [Nanoarchaeota archaeon]|nr:hypothetical protein [Nanoarchaeota archaeon]
MEIVQEVRESPGGTRPFQGQEGRAVGQEQIVETKFLEGEIVILDLSDGDGIFGEECNTFLSWGEFLGDYRIEKCRHRYSNI